MSGTVKGLRDARVIETEERLLRAAARLFVRHGYQGTTLAQIADAAGVSHRTVYVRFGTKPELLKRVTDVALVGDTEPIDVPTGTGSRPRSRPEHWTSASASSPLGPLI